MKLQHSAFLFIGLIAGQVMAQDAKPAATVAGAPPAAMEIPAMPDIQKLSSAVGMSWAESLKTYFPEANVDVIASTVKDIMAGKQPPLSKQEAGEILSTFQRVSNMRMAEAAKVAAEKNKAEGEAFLTKNAKEPGVVTLPSGLQYKEITPGTGATPKSTDTVMVNYRGTTIDGTEFDSSYGPKSKPVSVRVAGGVIPGWIEALKLMKVGSKWQIFVPSALGYGSAGHRPTIQGNSVLIFDIELLSIQESAVAPAGSAPQAVTGDILYVPSKEEMQKGAMPTRTNLPAAK